MDDISDVLLEIFTDLKKKPPKECAEGCVECGKIRIEHYEWCDSVITEIITDYYSSQ